MDESQASKVPARLVKKQPDRLTLFSQRASSEVDWKVKPRLIMAHPAPAIITPETLRFPLDFGQVREFCVYLLRITLSQQREELMSDSVSQEIAIIVGRVFSEWLIQLFQIPQNAGSGYFD